MKKSQTICRVVNALKGETKIQKCFRKCPKCSNHLVAVGSKFKTSKQNNDELWKWLHKNWNYQWHYNPDYKKWSSHILLRAL